MYQFLEVSGKSHSAEKCRRGTLWDLLNIYSVAKNKKLEGDLFEILKKTGEKVSQRQNQCTKKIWSRARL